MTHLELAWDVPPLARFLTELAGFTRLILFDKRGTGLSDRLSPDALPTLEERMDDVRAVMDAAGSERAALFGTLGGGAMSGLFAATYPDRAIALILYGTFAKLDLRVGMLSRLADSTEAALERVEREWGTDGVTASFWAPTLMQDEAAKDAFLRMARSSVSPAAARVLLKLGFLLDWGAFLPTIGVPTLVLHGTGDVVTPIEHGRRLAAGIPGAMFIELPGVDHLMWVGDQDPILREVRSFLDALEPRPASGRMLTTILFTDIVGSTEALARHGDRRWAELLAEHHRIAGGSWQPTGGRRSIRPATASSPRSTVRGGGSNAPRSSRGRPGPSASRSAPASTRARLSHQGGPPRHRGPHCGTGLLPGLPRAGPGHAHRPGSRRGIGDRVHRTGNPYPQGGAGHVPLFAVS